MIYQCPKCGRFVSNIIAIFDGLDEIVEVTADCKAHGKVELEYWDYDNFQEGEPDEPHP